MGAEDRYPKSLIDKLGVKPDSRVAVLGVNDPEFLAQAKERLGTASAPKPSKDLDFISTRGQCRGAGETEVIEDTLAARGCDLGRIP